MLQNQKSKFAGPRGGPFFVGAPVRPNMLNMPKFASDKEWNYVTFADGGHLYAHILVVTFLRFWSKVLNFSCTRVGLLFRPIRILVESGPSPRSKVKSATDGGADGHLPSFATASSGRKYGYTVNIRVKIDIHDIRFMRNELVMS